MAKAASLHPRVFCRRRGPAFDLGHYIDRFLGQIVEIVLDEFVRLLVQGLKAAALGHLQSTGRQCSIEGEKKLSRMQWEFEYQCRLT